MALSDEHIQKHLKEWTDLYLAGGDDGGGGHSGMSLNIFCGLLQEPPRRVAKLALALSPEIKTPKELGWSFMNGKWVKAKNKMIDGLYQYSYDEFPEDGEMIVKSYTYFRPST